MQEIVNKVGGCETNTLFYRSLAFKSKPGRKIKIAAPTNDIAKRVGDIYID